MKRAAVRALLSITLLLQLPAAARAAAPKWMITPFGGYTWFEEPLEDAPYAGGRLSYRFPGVLGFQVAGGYSPTSIDVTDGEDVSFWHLTGDLTASTVGWEWGDIYMLLGGGYSSTQLKGGDAVATGTFEQGAGLHWWWSQRIGLNLEARNILLIPTSKNMDDSNINHVVAGAGLTFRFGGKPTDADGDGVPDGKDKCAGTPAGARVDATGCPTDQDKDGVFDGIDQCPDTPSGATVDARGCTTDADNDGVPDGVDQCADTPKGATVDARGCTSDADSDGVPDGVDQCANTPTGVTVDARGCPTDSDGDGVSDGADKCPGTAAGLKVDSEGCPIEVTEKETELLDTGMIRLEDVHFETGKADILPESQPMLDVVGAVLRKWTELWIQIGGHTDSRGSNAANQKLSEARAASVLSYLTGKFPELKAEQFTAVGFGESKPLVPNTSPANMARNRRVEFTVLNRDVLKREVERRKLLHK
jgi:outer membrane protein OmpA-like peptidoglycan-associated protein